MPYPHCGPKVPSVWGSGHDRAGGEVAVSPVAGDVLAQEVGLGGAPGLGVPSLGAGRVHLT